MIYIFQCVSFFLFFFLLFFYSFFHFFNFSFFSCFSFFHVFHFSHFFHFFIFLNFSSCLLFSFFLHFFFFFFFSFSFSLLGCSKSDFLGLNCFKISCDSFTKKKHFGCEVPPWAPSFPSILLSIFFEIKNFFSFFELLLFSFLFSFFSRKFLLFCFLVFLSCFIVGISIRVYLFPSKSVLHGDVVS